MNTGALLQYISSTHLFGINILLVSHSPSMAFERELGPSGAPIVQYDCMHPSISKIVAEKNRSQILIP